MPKVQVEQQGNPLGNLIQQGVNAFKSLTGPSQQDTNVAASTAGMTPENFQSQAMSMPNPMLSPPTVDNYLQMATARIAQAPERQDWVKPGWQNEARAEGQITPQDAPAYAKWYNKTILANPRESREGFDYNLPAYWNKEVKPGTNRNVVDGSDPNQHFPDTYKFPSEPNFSRESKYASAKAPYWEYQDKTGKWSANDSPTDLAQRTVDDNGRMWALENLAHNQEIHYNAKTAPYVKR